MKGRFDVVAYLKLFRFPLVFTAIADSATGCLIASRHEPLILACLAVSSASLYFFGMALNDIADLEKDKVQANSRVLPSGRLALTAARWACIILLVLSCSVLLIPGFPHLDQRLVAWGAIVICICAYNLFLKYPPVMGLVRAFNLLLGVSAVVTLDSNPPLWIFVAVAVPSFVYVTALTFVSTLEDEAFSRAKVFVGAGFMMAGALAAALLRPVVDAADRRSPSSGGLHGMIQNAIPHSQGFVFAGILAAWILHRAWAARDRKGIMFLVRDGVGGIIFLDAALAASVDGWAPGLCIAALIVPAILSVGIFKKLA